MLDLILTLAMIPTQPALQTAQFQPCVWPKTCKTAPAPVVEVAQFQPCVWPKTCKATPAPVLAQIQTCVWPNRCNKPA